MATRADYCARCRGRCRERVFVADRYEDDGRGGIRMIRNPRRRAPAWRRTNPRSRRVYRENPVLGIGIGWWLALGVGALLVYRQYQAASVRHLGPPGVVPAPYPGTTVVPTRPAVPGAPVPGYIVTTGGMPVYVPVTGTHVETASPSTTYHPTTPVPAADQGGTVYYAPPVADDQLTPTQLAAINALGN